MRSNGLKMANVNMRGKKELRLPCRCCSAIDLRSKERDQIMLREMKEYQP